MPRTARAIEAGLIYHVLNRGNGRMRLFHKPEDYAAFERVLAEGLQRYPLFSAPEEKETGTSQSFGIRIATLPDAGQRLNIE
jgi:hypothetical protein